MEYSILQKYNPWWIDKELIEKDEKILDFEKQKIQYEPDFINNDLSIPGVYTLKGPRQVGKSTALKMLIGKLIKDKKIDPQKIFFFQCDIVEDYKELADVIETYLGGLEESRAHKYIILDEVSFVEEWPRAIKHLIDRGDLKNASVILSGSLSLDLKGGAELMPGRRGKAEKVDFELLPVNFAQYLKLHKIDIPDFDAASLLRNRADKRILSSQKLAEIANLKVKIKNLFDKYLLSGGFLSAINELEENKKISDSTYRIYWQWLKGDLLKLERKETVFLEVMQEVIKHIGGTVSYNDIAKNISIHSHASVMEYLDIAQKSFILNLAHNFDLNKRLPNLRKQKKANFIDPFLFHVINGQILGGVKFWETSQDSILVKKPALIEGIASNFLRKFFSKSGFWRNGSEVDFVGIDKNFTVGAEIKVRNKIQKSDIEKVKENFDKFIIISKDDFNVFEDVLIIPYWMILALSSGI